MAGLGGVGASLVAAVRSSRSTRCCFPAFVALGLGVGRARDRRCAGRRLGARLALFYGLIALLAFWLSFGPDAGLYTAFYHTIPVFSFLRAPGRIGIMVVLVLVGARRARARRCSLARARPAACDGGASLLVAAAELMQAPLTQFRRRSRSPPVYRTLATAARRRWSSSRTSTSAATFRATRSTC